MENENSFETKGKEWMELRAKTGAKQKKEEVHKEDQDNALELPT